MDTPESTARSTGLVHTGSADREGMSELRFLVPDMCCHHCANAVAAEISNARGVEDVDIDVSTGWVLVHGRALHIEAVHAATAAAGHHAEL